MLAAYLLLLPYLPDSARWMLDYMDIEQYLGALAGVGDLRILLGICRHEWGVREKLDLAMRLVDR